MATVTGQASSASRVRSAANAVTGPHVQRITIAPDPYATPAEQAASAAQAVDAPSSYVYAPGLISGLYE